MENYYDDFRLPNERPSEDTPENGEKVIARLDNNKLLLVQWFEKGKAPDGQVEYTPDPTRAYDDRGNLYEIKGWCQLNDLVKEYGQLQLQLLLFKTGLRLN